MTIVRVELPIVPSARHNAPIEFSLREWVTFVRTTIIDHMHVAVFSAQHSELMFFDFGRVAARGEFFEGPEL
jgi:hypothetical protein